MVDQELQALPKNAWDSLLGILRNPLIDPSRSMLALCKRVPLEKTVEGIPRPWEVRPVDIFSIILRCISSVQMDQLKEWRAKILHKGRAAMRGGTLEAIARITYMTEACTYGLRPVFALSLDFSRLFNSICPRVAHVAGMSEENVRTLLAPILSAKYIWRMPFSSVVPAITIGRGLPQGLSTSVTLAELFLGALVWKVSYSGEVEVVSYLDDITFLTSTKEELRRAIEITCQFQEIFQVQVSIEKSKLWGSNQRQLVEISGVYGYLLSLRLMVWD